MFPERSEMTTEEVSRAIDAKENSGWWYAETLERKIKELEAEIVRLRSARPPMDQERDDCRREISLDGLPNTTGVEIPIVTMCLFRAEENIAGGRRESSAKWISGYFRERLYGAKPPVNGDYRAHLVIKKLWRSSNNQ